MVAKTPELLAPAGSWEALKAAVCNGADAVYFGLPDFNARLRAKNFTREELPRVFEYLRAHNAKGYVTFNTLLFPSELDAAVPLLDAVGRAGADAVIVQDLGVVALLRRLIPALPVHASTQMTLADARATRLVRSLGVSRVILARELSLAQIGALLADDPGEVEVFAHGALCVSFSGQCHASAALGGRSANRGRCAQPCRLPWTLDGKGVGRGPAHPLSPRDLAAYPRVAALAALGVAGLKIEGRLKGPEYVAAAVRLYRAALDAAAAGRTFCPDAEMERDLSLSFSRGFCTGRLDGVAHGDFVDGRFPGNRGLWLGTVARIAGRDVVVRLEEQGGGAEALKPGDGLFFEGADPGAGAGGRVIAVSPGADRSEVALRFRREDLDPQAVRAGAAAWKTDDPRSRKRLEATWSRDRVPRPAALRVRADARPGGALSVVFGDGVHESRVSWPGPVQRAEVHALDEAQLRAQFGRLGGTPFVLESAALDAPDPVMVPLSALARLRREGVAALQEARRAAAERPVADGAALDGLRDAARARRGSNGAPARVTAVLVRSPAQLDALLEGASAGSWRLPGLVYCDFPGAGERGEGLRRLRESGAAAGLATARVLLPGEEDCEEILDLAPDAVLVRNLSALSFLRGRCSGAVLVGDASLNATNELAAELLVSLGLDVLTPGLDLSGRELEAFLAAFPAERVEALVHHRVPLFHSAHCLWAANGGEAGDCRNACAAPLALRDRDGTPCPVLADGQCRNTVYAARARAAPSESRGLSAAGVRRFRVELLDERGQALGRVLARWCPPGP